MGSKDSSGANRRMPKQKDMSSDRTEMRLGQRGRSPLSRS